MFSIHNLHFYISYNLLHESVVPTIWDLTNDVMWNTGIGCIVILLILSLRLFMSWESGMWIDISSII